MNLENILFKIHEFFSNRQPPEIRCPRCDCAGMYYKATIETRKIERTTYTIKIYECRRCKKQIEIEEVEK